MNYQFNINPDKIKARDFILNNHYLKTCPVSLFTFTLEEDGQILGVCLFSRPSRQNITIDGCKEILELSRLCLVDSAPKNSESYFIGCCLRWLKQNTNYEAILSYADSTEGHTGTIYKAANFTLDCYARPNYHYETSEGKRLHKRQVWNRSRKSKVTEKEQAITEGLTKVPELRKARFVYYLIPMEHKKYIIYVLIDPRTELVRYVGKSTTGKGRYRHHINPCEMNKNTPKVNWVKSLKKIGLAPVFKILESYLDDVELAEHERFYISYLRSLGCQLTNLTDGGEGTSGRITSQETKNKIRDKALARGARTDIVHNKRVNVFENGVESRCCFTCKVTKPLTGYAFNKKLERYYGTCRDCERERCKQRRIIDPPKLKYVKLSPEAYKASRIEAARKGGEAIANNPELRAQIALKNSKPVIGTHEHNNSTVEFPSAWKAKEHGFHNALISKAIQTGRPYMGYTWKFKKVA